MALSAERLDIPLVVGQEVAYFNPYQMMGVASVNHSTIARILKTVVVLADGERFRRSTLDQSRGSGFEMRSVYLYHRDDPKVEEQRRKVGEANRLSRAKTAASGFLSGGKNPKEVILAMTPFLPADQRSAIEAALQ